MRKCDVRGVGVGKMVLVGGFSYVCLNVCTECKGCMHLFADLFEI